MSIGLPTLFLPSQNRSQFVNAQVYSKPHADVMRWPGSVLDAAELERMRSKGLPAVNGYIYKSIVDAANSPNLSNEVSSIIRKALINVPDDGVLNSHLSALGIAGADQVAQLVKQIALRQRSIDVDANL